MPVTILYGYLVVLQIERRKGPWIDRAGGAKVIGRPAVMSFRDTFLMSMSASPFLWRIVPIINYVLKLHYHSFIWRYSVSSCLLVNAVVGQSLIVKFNNLPPSGDRIRVLCELNGALVYQSQFDYAPGTLVLNKEIQLPVAMGYQLRAAATKGIRKLALIVASSKSDKLDILVGLQGATIALSPPQAALVRGAAVQGGTTVYFRYDDAGALLRTGNAATLWCTDKDLKINTSGRQIIAPIKVGSDGRLVAVFVVPASDRPTYCQAGYYSEQLTPTGQIPIFVYPDLTSGAPPLNVNAFSASLSNGSSLPLDSSADAVSLVGSPGRGRTSSTVTAGKTGRLERTSPTK